jgi:hypothetical protein
MRKIQNLFDYRFFKFQGGVFYVDYVSS